jgi:hypothetical protein
MGKYVSKMKKRAIEIGVVVGMALILVSLALSPSSAVHYSVTITTDNTTWTFERTELPISFEMAGTVSGYGTMIQDHDINLAGVSKKSLTYALPGEVTTSENLDVKSSPKPLITVIIVKGDNVTANITAPQPTSLIDETELSYFGERISSWERYCNNYDVVWSKVEATRLEKESSCNATLTSSEVNAAISPGSVKEEQSFIKGTDYQLKSASDLSAHIGYKQVLDQEVVVSGSESYIGNYTVETALTMSELGREKPEEEPESWLPCPGEKP